jgi:hypothetical protein
MSLVNLLAPRKQRILAIGILCMSIAAPVLKAQWLGYREAGTPRLANGKVNLAAPPPKTADGKVDLSGVWESEGGYFTDLAKDLKPGEVQMLSWAKEVQAAREGNLHQGDLLSECMPPGVPRINMTSVGMTHAFKIVQTPKLVILLYETSANSTFRQVFMDGRQIPKDPQPTWLGYSVGHWEGNTLVVETSGFNGLAWIDTAKGHPQTENGKVIERFSRPDFGHLLIDITIDDPKAYATPWRAKVPVHMLPDADLIETYCENEKDHAHKHD